MPKRHARRQRSSERKTKLTTAQKPGQNTKPSPALSPKTWSAYERFAWQKKLPNLRRPKTAGKLWHPGVRRNPRALQRRPLWVASSECADRSTGLVECKPITDHDQQ